jgi:hypothetical protein
LLAFFKVSPVVIARRALDLKKITKPVLVDWTISRNDHFQQKAIDEFLDSEEADAWIVSYCLKHKYLLITHEVSQPTRKNKIKIPEPCKALGVSHLDTIGMFRKLGVQF